MMKLNRIYILIIVSFLFPQTSSLGIYGAGEKMESFDSASISLGDSRFFSGNLNSFSFSSPSSYWKSSLVKLYATVKFSTSDFGYNNNLQENHFQVFAFMFPVGENRACAFGMNPLYRSNIELMEEQLNYIGSDVSPSGNPLAFRTTYDFSGGISEFFIAYSMKVDNNISFGVRLSKLFGNSNYRFVLSLNDVSFDQEGNISYDETYTSFGNYKNRYSGYSYNLEARYEHEKISFVLSYLRTSSLKIKFTPEYDLIGETSYTENSIESYISHFGLGIKFLLDDNLGIIGEIHNSKSFQSYDFLNILKQNSPNILSIHFGLFKKINLKDEKVVNQINLRTGFYSKLYTVNNIDLSDSGVTFGIGFEYLNNNSAIDLSFLFGQRETEYLSMDNEKYSKFILSITSNDKWFERERK